jgi:hypothetical protein
LQGKKVENPPPILEVYELCKEFGWLPSQLAQEDNKTIEELMVVMNTINEYNQKQERKVKRKELAQKFGAIRR